MLAHDWNQFYLQGTDLPWDIGKPDESFVEFIQSGLVKPCKVLEVGCGTGTDAIWMAEQGFDVLGVDLSLEAVERAQKKLGGRNLKCNFKSMNFLKDDGLPSIFGLVVDRGCFHIFDEHLERSRFAQRVGQLLDPGGMWLSLIGSTEGPLRQVGPPRRTALEIIESIEPHLEIMELRSALLQCVGIEAVTAWRCLSRLRKISI